MDEINKSISCSDEFMLAELARNRTALDFYLNRFEGLLNFYLTAIGAILAAIVVVISQLNDPKVQLLLATILGTSASGLSLIIYLRLCITRTMMVRSIALERKNQEYFLAQNPTLRQFANVLMNGGNWKLWCQAIFTKQTLRLFRVFGLSVSVGAGISTSLALATSLVLAGYLVWVFNSFYIVIYVLAWIIGFVPASLVCNLILKRQQTQAEEFAKQALSGTVLL
jgi:hypothetical protein